MLKACKLNVVLLNTSKTVITKTIEFVCYSWSWGQVENFRITLQTNNMHQVKANAKFNAIQTHNSFTPNLAIKTAFW